jgi:hypothetical protein
MFRLRTIVVVSLLASVGIVASGEELPEMKPLLGERGELLFEATFDDPAAEPLHPIAAAKAEIVEGVLRLSKRTDAKHIGVASLWKRDVEPIEDFLLEADFCWRGAYGFNFEFKKPGPVKHGDPPEFFVTFGKPGDPKRPMTWAIRDNAPKNTVGMQSMPVAEGQWLRVLIEVKEGEVAVQLSNGATLRGPCNLASSPKGSPSMSFSGADESKAVDVDNLRVWAMR